MRLKILLTAFVMGLLFAGIGGSSAVLADEPGDFVFAGSVDLGVRSVSDGDKSAKFQEYRDLKPGVFSDLTFGGDNGAYFMDFTGDNIGRNDQKFEMEGGKFGAFKYSLHYDEIVHNYAFDAKTFYSGVGTSRLDYSVPSRAKNTDAAYTPAISTDAGLWGSTFDYSVKRKDTGAMLDFTFGTPFYFTVDANQVETKGVRPVGAPSGVYLDRKGFQGSAFGNVVELPAPVDYRTHNMNLKAGYNTKTVSVGVSGLLSRFENANDILAWRNPFVSTESFSGINSMPSDNNYYKVNAHGAMKKLPLNSSLAMQVGYSKLKNEIPLMTTIPYATSGTATTTPTYKAQTLGLNNQTFKGDIEYNTASVALTSQPVKALSTKIYYNYLKKRNTSTPIEYEYHGTADSELFEYEKNNAGVDLGFKVTPKTKLGVGYEYLMMKRNPRPDAANNKDNSFYGEVKNSSLDWLTAKVKYQRLWRTSSFENGSDGAGPTDPLYIHRFVRRFDATDKVQDSLKFGVDIAPLTHLDIGLEYIYKKNDYKDTILGRLSDERNEYYADVAYTMPERFKLTAFVNYEQVIAKSYHRYISPSGSFSFDPSASPVNTSYNWSEDLTDKSWMYGFGLEVPAIKDRLTFVASWIYEKANGQADFSSQNNLGTPLNISPYNDYTKQGLNLKAIYKATKNLDLTLGFAYEKFEYKDEQWDGYQNVMTSAVSPNTYLTGAYNYQNYDVNMLYFMASYKF